MSDIKTIYHGSANIVKVPVYGHGKINNDYFRQLLHESFNNVRGR